MDKKTGGPAFPAFISASTATDTACFSSTSGMSLRDAFALSIIGGMMADGTRVGTFEQLAKEAWKQADAMLHERDSPASSASLAMNPPVRVWPPKIPAKGSAPSPTEAAPTSPNSTAA